MSTIFLVGVPSRWGVGTMAHTPYVDTASNHGTFQYAWPWLGCTALVSRTLCWSEWSSIKKVVPTVGARSLPQVKDFVNPFALFPRQV